MPGLFTNKNVTILYQGSCIGTLWEFSRLSHVHLLVYTAYDVSMAVKSNGACNNSSKIRDQYDL